MGLGRTTAGWLVCWFVLANVRAAEPADYLRDVKPILAKRCYTCHGPFQQKAGLRLDTGEAIRRGGESGPAAVGTKPETSPIIGAITGSIGFRMPPESDGTALTESEIAIIRRWIADGATSPENEQPAEDPRAFWSYQPMRRPLVPPVQNTWPRNGIDSFVAAKHVEHGLTPNPEAPRAVLLRRVYLDLIGVPPTRDELHEFLADDSPNAFEKVVDRLLAHPGYGQRWGRHWMDVWRYSDWYGSRGINEIRYSQRHIWRWRDWIVESLNEDKGYDRMIVEMLAGDELEPGNLDVARATGFLGRNWYKFDRNVWMFETVEQTSQAFLGLTMKCCRCHDHKFEPITQLDYYRFRAFFEPHDVRTDPFAASLETEKDATLGQVLKEGVSFVYDKDVAVPTFVFARGDSRYPQKDQPLTPAVPLTLTSQPMEILPITLPAEVIAPHLRESVVGGLEQQAQSAIAAAETRRTESVAAVSETKQRLEAFRAGQVAAPLAGAHFRDDFSQPRPEVWQSIGGQWDYENGRVVQKQVGTFPTMKAAVALPRDFAARLKYTTLETGAIHSVGLFFDVIDLRDGQAIYTATNNTTATVQAFHRAQGVEHYPSAGIFPCAIQLNQEVTLDIAVRGQQINVWINGELRLVYSMPAPRRDGAFALWTHAGSAAFDELQFDPLPGGFRLANAVTDKTRSPYQPLELADFERAVEAAERAIAIVERQIGAAQAEFASLIARVAADRAKLTAAPTADELALAAAKAERTAGVAKAEWEFAQADGDAKVMAAKTSLETAQANLAKSDSAYTPLGPIHPATSTGRRLALARWIADPRNPRTARVAVNHMWLRHFGEAIVPTVANFGLNGRRPSHPELLDWIASQFVDEQWSMKELHRRLVTAATYRLSSAAPAAPRDNQFLWRMNPRRAESEVVRDSVLYVAGALNPVVGGPEIPEATGLDSRRRSLYFRSTPNEKMPFLEFFDQANPNECYRRLESIVPQQSLALFNSSLSIDMARRLARQISADYPSADSAAFLRAAFEQILTRPPTNAELVACRNFLDRHTSLLAASPSSPFPAANPSVVPAAVLPADRAKENLIHVLLNHHDFVTIK